MVKPVSANVGCPFLAELAGAVCPSKEVDEMRDRQKQRELKRKQKKEEIIDKRNSYGIKDLTAYNAVLQIKTNGTANIALR